MFQDILTLIDEDPDQPEICQVWFEVKTSKICNRNTHLPLVIKENDFSTSKNQVTKSGKWSGINSISLHCQYKYIPHTRRLYQYYCCRDILLMLVLRLKMLSYKILKYIKSMLL